MPTTRLFSDNEISRWEVILRRAREVELALLLYVVAMSGIHVPLTVEQVGRLLSLRNMRA